MNYQICLLNFGRLLLMIFALFGSVSIIVAAEKTERPPVTDFDGDGKADIAVFRRSNGFWHIKKSSGGFLSFQWGLGTDDPAPSDYDGDGKAEAGIHRKTLPSPTSDWYILRIQDFSFTGGRLPTNFVGERVIPTPADFDGDGKTDLAYYSLSDVFGGSGRYIVQRSSTGTIVNLVWGVTSLGDRPVPADYDGDGKTDYAVYRSGTWFILQSSNGMVRVEYFGLATDKVVPGDYDGDGKADLAVWRASNGFWYTFLSRDNSMQSIHFGASDDKPIPADYDGDNKTDIAVFRPSSGVWYLRQSSGGIRAEHFGLANDTPLPSAFVR